MAQLPIDEALNRFKDNEGRLDKFVNDATGYTSSTGENVESIPAFLERQEQEIEETTGTVAENLALSESYKTAAESARDAAIIQSGVYVDEPTGRAAVADGVAFKVQGSGEVAAYEYRRVNSSSSTLIAVYPAKAAFDALGLSVEELERITGANFTISPNLFNKNDSGYTSDYFVNHTNGNLQSNADYDSSGFLPVEELSTYYIFPKTYIAWYNSNKQFISGSSATDTNNVQTAPAGAVYLRFSINNTSGTAQNSAYVVEGSSPLSPYQNYGAVVTGSRVVGIERENLGVTLGAVIAYLERITNGGLTISPNLFNKNDSEHTVGYFVNHTNGNLQVEATAGTYEASGFIPVEAGLEYYLYSKSFIAWYDYNKVYISGSSNADTNNVQTAPAGAVYLRTSVYKSGGVTKDNFYVRQGNTPLSQYEEYGSKPTASRIIDLDSAQIKNGAITAVKTDFLNRTKNLFDKAAITANTFMGANGTPVANSTYAVSDFIEVEPGETYFCQGTSQQMRFWTAFDAAKVVVPAYGSNDAGTTIVVPETGVRYYRFTLFQSEINSYQFEKGSSRTSFESFGYEFDEKIILPTEASWLDKVTYSFGDSITAQNAWQPAIAAELGLLHTSYGVGGRQVCGSSGMCQDAAINALPLGADLIMVLGGTNDWAQSRVLGLTTSANTEEFYGAYNQMCQKLTTRFPTARIVLLTTPYGELPARVTDEIWTTAHTNIAGLTTRDYAEAVRTMGKRWGMPVIDLSDCGWNAINVDTYMVDDGGHIHPNALGGARIAEVCIGRLKALQPLS